MLRWIGLGLVGLVTVVATVLVLAPATWLAAGLRSATHGRIELAETTGTLWSGEGTVVFASGIDPGSARASLPERLSWHLSPWQLLIGSVHLTLSHPSALSQPMLVRITPGGNMTIGATTLRLPASLLAGLGTPFNTIRPGGVLSIELGGLQFSGNKMEGEITGEWQFASSALSTVSPLGHYRMQTKGAFPGTQVALTTISGPLELTGSGTIAEGGRLRFEGRAQPIAGADAAIKAQLNGLISLLGRRDGEAAILRFPN